MEAFIERLIKEKDELTEKMDKLMDFIKSTKFLELHEIHQALLTIQYNAMKTYQQCLIERLNLLEPKTSN